VEAQHVTSARSGSLIGATWLIGLGTIFLIQRFADLSWGQAWPLFVILIGVAGLVSAIIRGRFDASGIWAFTWPVAWIVIGVLLLMSTTVAIGRGPAELIAEYWPWALIALGIWFVIGAVLPAGRGLAETLTIPLAGTADAGVRIRFGAGNLAVRAAAPGQLVDGTFEGGVTHRVLGPGRIELVQDTRFGVPWLERTSRWDVGLSAEVPLDVKVDAGASRTILDLRDLRVRNLDLQTGASETRVMVPRAAGATSIRAQTGAASLTIEIPAGVAARIRTRMALGSTQVDQTRFPAGAAGYESADYATAANRVEIDVQGGVGSLRVVGGDQV
jgi:hypothetical protein